MAPHRTAALPASGTEITLPALIRARQIVTVKSDVRGAVSELLVDAGQEVYQGQIVARISNQGAESAREAAKSAVEAAQARVTKVESAIISARMEASRARADAQRAHEEFQRVDKLYRRQKYLLSEGATPRLAYEKSEKEFRNSEAEYGSLDTLARHAEDRVDGLLSELQTAKQILDDKNKQLDGAQAEIKAGEIASPVDGIVAARRTEPGKEVGGDNPSELFDIMVNPTALEAVVEADPGALARLHPGQTVMLFFADLPNEGIPATLREIRQGDFVADFTSPDPAIKHGVTAQARFKFL